MKKKLPYILNFNDIYETYSSSEVYDPLDFFFHFNKPAVPDHIDKTKLPGYEKSAKGMGEEKQKKVMQLLTKYKNEIDEIEDAMLEFVQFQILMDPQITIARTKDIKTGIEYFTAKTFFPLKGGKKKEVKIYIGKSKEFGNDTKNKHALDAAYLKMRQTLSRRLREGSL